jgi:peptidoglycan/xylan/chitin deacetylase (PgdA/CDA1 family)
MITLKRIIHKNNIVLMLICLISFSCTSPVSNCKEGGVVITFDDAYIDEWYSIRDLLNTYKAKVTFFVARFDRLNEDQIKKLKIFRNDGHEIAFHGLRHLNAVNFVKDNSVEKYLEVEILPGINIMKNKGFYPLSFSYPFVAHTSRIDNALFNLF